MIKECVVTLSNKEVMVVKYGDKEVQMPSNGILFNINSTVYVKCDKNRYSLSTKEDFDKSNQKTVEKADNKKESKVADNVEK